MTSSDNRFDVVRNDEHQYSIWPTGADLPRGWTPTGFAGPRDACLAHIDEVWTDMRPASLRRAMDGRGPSGGDQQEPEEAGWTRATGND